MSELKVTCSFTKHTMEDTATNHAVKLYIEFGNHVADRKHDPRLLNHEFTLFLEDILVNEPTVTSMSHSDKVVVIACLLIFNAQANYIAQVNQPSPEDGSIIISILMAALATRSADNSDIQHDFIKSYVATKYVWSGTEMLCWNQSLWVPCAGVDPTPMKTDMWSTLKVHTYGIQSPVVEEATTIVNSHILSLEHHVSEWCEDSTVLVALVKANTVTLNRNSFKISVFNGSVNLNEERLGPVNISDYSTLALPYTPAQVHSDAPVTQIFSNFGCELSEIKEVARSCLSGDGHLIFIFGLERSGCTTLWTLLKNMCGPYADPTITGHRAVFLGSDDVEILHDAQKLSQYPTIVFDGEVPSDIEDQHQGRTVTRLVLERTIPLTQRVPEVAQSYSTRLRLTYVLGLLILSEAEQNDMLAGIESMFGPDILKAIDDDENIDFTSVGMNFLSKAFSMMGGSTGPKYDDDVD